MNELLELSYNTIGSFLENKKLNIPNEIIKKYCKKQACFVTITINDELRGCIGSLEPIQELYKDIIENSINAAFRDPRFPGLSKEEFDEIKIEISILSIPKKLEFKDSDDLLKKINNKMGLILKKGSYQSTFLPQVWEQLPDKIQFLEHLSQKAGLPKDTWKSSEFLYYTVEKIN